MTRRSIGFAFVSVAIVGTILAFTNAEGYDARRGFVWNMQHAVVLRLDNGGPPAPLILDDGNTDSAVDDDESPTGGLFDFLDALEGAGGGLGVHVSDDTQEPAGELRTDRLRGAGERATDGPGARPPVFTSSLETPPTQDPATIGAPAPSTTDITLGHALAGLAALGLYGLGLFVGRDEEHPASAP